jgi:hypothetical protein
MGLASPLGVASLFMLYMPMKKLLNATFAGKDLSKNKLINSDLVEWCNSIQETTHADVD